VSVIISPFETIYLASWSLALAISLFFVLRNRKDYEFLHSSYWLFLTERWKVVTFLIATAIITIAAPYSGDPTWDYADSIIISVLTYLFAPWSVAIIVRSVRGRNLGAKLFVALCFFMVPIWAYDLYILFRDQVYPPAWQSNISISGVIVVSAGLFWNLGWKEGVGAVFVFSEKTWPPTWRTSFRHIAPYAFLLMIPVIGSVFWFVYVFFWGT